MSAPLNLSISSEIVSSMSSLNMYSSDNSSEKYISELYPETILAMKHLNKAIDSIRSNIFVSFDLEKLKSASFNKNIDEVYNSLSISDDLEYKKELLLAKEALMSIKHLDYMIEHAIEHIDSALSFNIIKINFYFLKSLFFDMIEKHKDNENSINKILNRIHDYISLESTLKGKNNERFI